MIKFKYRDQGERTLKILRDKKLYFPLAAQLNDPLDSQINIDNEYRKVVEKYPPQKSEEYLRKSFLIHILNQHNFTNENGVSIGLNGALQSFISALGICSLSDTSTDALLWSHYGGSHAGICLGFDMDLIDAKGIFIRGPIEYAKQPPYQDLFIKLADKLGEFCRPWEENHSYPDEVGDSFYTYQLSQLMHANLLVKSEKWKYEEEYRLISNHPGFHDFSPKALKTVIFGIKADVGFINKVKTLLDNQDYEHVQIKYVQHVTGSFEFEVVNYCDALMTLDRIT